MLNPLNLISKFIKSPNQKELARLEKIVLKINELEPKFAQLENKDFPIKTSEFKERIKQGESLDLLLPEVFACAREASTRTIKERPFDVQIMGSIALHEGKIAEMKTGEGKTLTIVLTAYLNALTEEGVHIVTVNDYLAKRDCLNMGQIYAFLGLKSGYVNNEQDDYERKKNYDCDITYATNSELGFDFLRDNLKFSKDQLVQRKHKFCIVDEVDSVLIDEARVPLIISGILEDKSDQYLAIDRLVKKLSKTDYEIDEKDKSVLLTNQGIDSVEKILINAGVLKNNNFYDPSNLSLVHHVNQALKANHLFEKGRDYIVKDDQIVIIDEQTGRQLPGRRFGDGLGSSIEAKERVNIQPENQTVASTTYQNYFKLYEKISGCTGTAVTEAEEFFEIYNLTIISIPTNKQMIRKDWNDQIFRTTKEKDEAIVKKISETNSNGQPLLIFTASINKSEHYSKLLKVKNIKHTVLNAKNHEKEAEIIANAGKKYSLIITTSISGRGVDIKLGGKPENENDPKYLKDKEEIKSLGGLFVISTERMESRRVDNQARGRSGRQGDEGNSIFYISLEDDLMRIFGSESMSNMLEKLGLKDGESIDHPWINKAIERSQEKVESRNFDIRRQLLKFDMVHNDQRQVIFSERTKVMNNNEIFSYSDSFLNEIIENLSNNKKRYLINPKSNEFYKKLIAVFGKSFNDQEINKLIKLSDKNFAFEIKEKFKEKRNERIKLLGQDQAQGIEKRIFLQIIDSNYKSHIQYLEQLRQVIVLRGYGGRDPLIEYKKEAFSLFENLLEKLKTDLVTILINLSIVQKPIENVEETKEKKAPFTFGKKMKRNEPCYCGSGKKYKHCHGSL